MHVDGEAGRTGARADRLVVVVVVEMASCMRVATFDVDKYVHALRLAIISGGR